jgi:hypothetical protein
MTDLCDEPSHRIFRLRRARVVSQQCALPRCRRARWWRRRKVRIWCCKWVGIHQQHELDVASSNECVNVIVLERVDFLEISGVGISVDNMKGFESWLLATASGHVDAKRG